LGEVQLLILATKVFLESLKLLQELKVISLILLKLNADFLIVHFQELGSDLQLASIRQIHHHFSFVLTLMHLAIDRLLFSGVNQRIEESVWVLT
jgi:hypothetical protein